ncbi:hypothetical protein CRUP_038194 [Coryphaenoides rupestris]|nr:hypothetical protein CRUP_038194 [Coryphaenoides rupestris]
MATFVSMATCHTCNKTSRYNGVNRDFTMALSRTRGGPGGCGGGGKFKSPPASVNRSHPGTPKSAGKGKTPASKTPSKMKTPSKSPSTPGSGSTASSSSASPKSAGSVKKWVVRGLSKILNRDQKTDSKRGTLKDFLSSL